MVYEIYNYVTLCRMHECVVSEIIQQSFHACMMICGNASLYHICGHHRDIYAERVGEREGEISTQEFRCETCVCAINRACVHA